MLVSTFHSSSVKPQVLTAVSFAVLIPLDWNRSSKSATKTGDSGEVYKTSKLFKLKSESEPGQPLNFVGTWAATASPPYQQAWLR